MKVADLFNSISVLPSNFNKTHCQYVFSDACQLYHITSIIDIEQFSYQSENDSYITGTNSTFKWEVFLSKEEKKRYFLR